MVIVHFRKDLKFLIQTNLKKFISVISKALNQTIMRRVKAMSAELQKNRFIDLSVKLKDPENHFAFTTIPWIISKYEHFFFHFLKMKGNIFGKIQFSFLVLGICVVIVMILSSINSFICKICSESFNEVEKTMIPMEEHGKNFEFTNIIDMENEK